MKDLCLRLNSTACVWRRLDAAIRLSGNFERRAGTHNKGRAAHDARCLYFSLDNG